MAEEVQIEGTGEVGKIRNPLGIIGLAIITLGIYGLVWYYKLNKELAFIGHAKGSEECGTSPVTSLIAVTLGALILVPPFVSAYRFCTRLTAAERLTGTPAGMEPALLFLLYVFISPVAAYIAQSNMNKVLQAQAQAQAQAGAGQGVGPEAPGYAG